MVTSTLFLLALASSVAATPASKSFPRQAAPDVCFNDPNLKPPQPTAPGGLDRNWMTIPCSIKEVVNTGGAFKPPQRWAAAQASNAFDAAQLCWSSSKTASKFSFSQSVSNFIHGKDGMKCEILDQSGGALSGCSETHQCDAAGHAAGFQVLNSLTAIHKMNQGTFDALEGAKVNIIGRAGVFASTFSPTIDELKQLKIFIDIVGMGFAVAAAPIWNAALKTGWLRSDPNSLGILKDSVNGIVSNSLTLGKDIASQANNALKTQNTLSNKITILINAWKQKVADANAFLFSGDPKTLQLLMNMVDNGKMLDYNGVVESSLVGPILEKTLWAVMLPWAWALSNAHVFPFIMIADDPAEHNQCSNLKAGGYIKNSDKVFACVNGRAYWLANAPGPSTGYAETCVQSDQTPVCTPNPFEVPPGVDQLTANGPWQGLSVLDVITSSVNSYMANGNKNGYVPDTSQNSVVDDLGTKGVQAAGMFTLPICTYTEAWTNWGGGPVASKPNYPCN